MRRTPRSGGPGPAAATPATAGVAAASPAFPWRVVVVIFLLGLALRVVALAGSHIEGDEVVYRTLVQQLDAGRGYTLQGTPLVGGRYPAEQYGRPLFFHPPGGVGLFWLLHRAFGEAGYPLAQVLSYALFFAGLLLMGRVLPAPQTRLQVAVLAALAAFTPIMTHVTSRYWLDGPLLAFSTAAGALFLHAVRRGSVRWAAAAGLLLGYASLIKTAAFLVLPGFLFMAWALAEPAPRRTALRLTLCFVALAALVQLPWEIWQYAVLGSPFPVWAGRPDAGLVATNPYVNYVTVVRSPWEYLGLLPRVAWTVAPAVLGLFALRPAARTRRTGLALLGWMLVILGVHIGLGFSGYSKVLRYAILLTPATVLLFALVAGEAGRTLAATHARRGKRLLTMTIAVMLAAGFVLEIVQGVVTPLFQRDYALIRPLFSP